MAGTPPSSWTTGFPVGLQSRGRKRVTGVRTFHLFPGDITNELVRHFLIETSPRGVKLKGCPNEPNFGECSKCASHMRGWVGRALPLLDYQSRAVRYLGQPLPLLLPLVPT